MKAKQDYKNALLIQAKTGKLSNCTTNYVISYRETETGI
jgi:hypothetical protein